MPACWCRARRNRCARARATASPAPGRRRGRYCRTTRWQTRAGSARWIALGRVSQGQASLRRASGFSVLIAQAADQIGDMVRHALIDDVVVHGPQLLADLGLDLTAQSCLGFRGIHRRAHGISGFWLVRSWLVRLRLYRFEIGPSVFHFAIFPPFAHVKPALGTHKPHRVGPTPGFAHCSRAAELFGTFFSRLRFCRLASANPEGEGAVPNSQAVLQHLPFLRRYARALTGSQSSGDAYVAATLESLIASPEMLAESANSRVGLYRLFTKIWGSLAVNGKAEAGDSVLAPEQHITQITPRPRQAFLLVALEGFSEEDA